LAAAKVTGLGKDQKSMPALLYGIGAFVLFAGLVMIGFGVPINEFSFGNTLISAGTTAVVGGLILIGLGVVAGQLRRVAEALNAQAPARPSQPSDAVENIGESRPALSQGRMAFPSRARPEPQPAELGMPSPASAAMPFDDKSAEVFAPTLRNPDQDSETIEDDISLSPPHPLPSSAPASVGAGSGMMDKNREGGWRSSAPSSPPSASPPVRPLPSANFDAMWPAEAKLPKAPTINEPAEAKPAAPPREAKVLPPKRPELEKPRAAAILKSGVVDGMGYTLYVDGSIEAELPQGTLRFASINELRSHIAKNS
jgi:hypothetical protein